MADVRKTVEVAYKADVTSLVKEVKKLPSVTEKEAKAMTAALTKNLKASENAAKKAAKTTEKSFQKMGASAKKAGLEYRKLKRTSMELGRGFGEVSMLLSETDSAFGNMAGQAAAFSMTAGALAPLVGNLAMGIRAMGLVAGGVALGGIGLLIGGIAAFATGTNDAEEAAKKQKEETERLNKKIEEYNKTIEKAVTKSRQLKEQMFDAAAAIESLKDSVQIESLRIRAEIDPTLTQDLQNLQEEVAFKGIDRRVKNEFDKVDNVIKDQLSTQTTLVTAQRKKVEALISMPLPLQIQSVIKNSEFEDLERNINKGLNKTLTRVRKESGKEKTVIMDIDEESSVNAANAILSELENLRRAQDELTIIENQNKQFRETRIKDEAQLTKQLKDNFVIENELADLKNFEESKANRRAKRAEKRAADIQAVKKIEMDLTTEMLSKEDKQLQKIDKQLIDLATSKSKNTNVDNAINLLLEKRQKIIDDSKQAENAEEAKKQLDERKQAQENINKSLEFQLRLLREMNEDRTIGFTDLLDLQEKYEDSIIESEQRIHAEVTRMIDERNRKALEGTKFLIGSIDSFGSAINEVMENTGARNEKLIQQLFALQQAGAVANIAMKTAENITTAQGFPPPLNIIGTGAAIAVGAAQTAAVLSQSPPKKHMGGMIQPDEVGNVTMLRGEAVLDRATVRNIGEEGVRRLQENRMNPEVVVIQPFKHFDRYLTGRNRRQKKSVNTGY